MFNPRLVHEELFQKIRIMANRSRFKMLEMTQTEPKTVTELSKGTNLAYNKCADYVSMLEKEGLIEKKRLGRETMVKSTVDLSKLKIRSR